MAKLIYGTTGSKIYETGVKDAVLYPFSSADASKPYPKGVAWPGIASITESPEGAEATAIYADDAKYLNLYSAESLKATIEAYMAPPEFQECDGNAEIADGISVGQQTRKSFGLCYKTTIGNDTEGNAHGYKYHLIYGAMAAPSEKGFSTINDSPEAITFSWELSTTPVNVKGLKPTASVVIDSTKVDPEKLAILEAALYGSDDPDSSAYLPLPDEIVEMLK